MPIITKPQARKFLHAACINASMHCARAGDKCVRHSQMESSMHGHIFPGVLEAAHVAEVACSFDAEMYQ